MRQAILISDGPVYWNIHTTLIHGELMAVHKTQSSSQQVDFVQTWLRKGELP